MKPPEQASAARVRRAPSGVLRPLHAALSTLATLALWVAAIGLVAMTVAIGWQVFGRYVLNDSPAWTEPLATLLMSWFILIGAAVGVRENNHLGFELGLHVAPPRLRFAMRLVTEVLILGFGLAMAWYGAVLASSRWSALMAGLPIPDGWDYVPMAAGGFLIALFALERLVGLFVPREA